MPDSPVLTLDIPVAWGDMDAFGHVNNTQFFKYCESTRMKYFEKIGLIDCMNSQGIGPILAKIECKFIRPLFYPDTLTVGLTVHNLQSSSFELAYRISSHKTGELSALAQDKIVIFDYGAQVKAELPLEIAQRVRELGVD